MFATNISLGRRNATNDACSVTNCPPIVALYVTLYLPARLATILLPPNRLPSGVVTVTVAALLSPFRLSVLSGIVTESPTNTFSGKVESFAAKANKHSTVAETSIAAASVRAIIFVFFVIVVSVVSP